MSLFLVFLSYDCMIVQLYNKTIGKTRQNSDEHLKVFTLEAEGMVQGLNACHTHKHEVLSSAS